MPFKPFSLAESVQAGQNIRMNQLRIQQAEAGMARQESLRGLAQMSTAPTTEPYQQPEEQTFPGEAPISGLKQAGPDIYSQEVHAERLAAAGETEMAADMQAQIAKMNDAQREDAAYKSEELAKLVFDAKGDPQKWDENFQIAVEEGFVTQEQYAPYSDDVWQRTMNQAKSVKELLKIDKKTSPYVKIDPSKHTTESLRVFERTGRYSDLNAIDEEDETPGSEFERHIRTLKDEKKLTEEQVLEYQRKRVGVLSGAEQTAHQEITTGMRAAKEIRRQTEALSKEASGGTEHFSNMNQSIDDAIAAIKSGDNALADTLLAQAMSQVQDTDVKAMQMYKEFDKTFGNVAERMIRGATRFISGGRNDAEKVEIISTLENFRESHVTPGLNKMKNIYRDMARGRGLDPFDVIPPRNPEEIRDYPGMLKAEKIKKLKLHFPEKFQ